MRIRIEYRGQVIEADEKMINDFFDWCYDNEMCMNSKTFELYIRDMAEN